jgi:hypothetical protein
MVQADKAKAYIRRFIEPIETWLNSTYFIGQEAHSLFDYWKREMVDYYNGNYNTIVLYGGISLGKTYVALIMILRLVYEIFCIANFPTLFDLSPTTKLKIVFVSITVGKAKSTGISRLLRMIDSIPFFQKECRRDRNIESKADFGFCEVIFASKVEHLTGEDVYSVIFDESNFVRAKAGAEFEIAKKMFLESRIRAKTRFSIAGEELGFFALLSSAGLTTSFTESQIRAAKTDKSIKVVQAAVYDVKPKGFSSERFSVFCGEGEVPAFFLDDVPSNVSGLIASSTGLSVEHFVAQFPDRVKTVPVDLRKYFEEDMEYCLQSLAGVAVLKSSRLLKNRKLLEEALCPLLSNPLKPGIEVVDLTLFGDEDINDYLDWEVLERNLEDGCRLYFHIDQSLTGDHTGLGVSYKSIETGRIRVPLKLDIYKAGGKGEEIDLSKVDDIIYQFRERGYTIGFVSYDSTRKYASQGLKKRLGKDKVGDLSVDRDDEAYLLFVYLLKKHALDMYWYPPFQDNFLELIHDQASHVVDHPPEAAKDVCDGVVGAVYNCFIYAGLSIEDIAYAGASARASAADGLYEAALASALNMGQDRDLGPSPDPMPKIVHSTADLREAIAEEEDWYTRLLNDNADN